MNSALIAFSVGIRSWQERSCRRLRSVRPRQAANHPEGLVQLHDIQQFIASNACQLQFGVEELSFGIEHLEIAVDAAHEECIG
jgi:hypothetical protein